MSFLKNLLWKLGGRRIRESILTAKLESWRVFHGRKDSSSQDVVVRVRTDKPSIPRGVRYDTAVLIEWPYEEGHRTLPSSEITERMFNFERAIDPLTSENGFAELVVVRTGLGKREWLFYSRDREKFMTEFNRLVAGHSRYPLEIFFDDDPEWNMWKGILADLEPHLQGSNVQKTN